MQKIRNEIKEIDKLLEKNFEQNIKELLEEGEQISYYPETTQSKDEIQKELIIDFLTNESLYRKQLIKKAKKLNELLNEAQSLQHTLNMLKEVEIVETPKSVVLKQIKRNYILIEEHYEKRNEDEYGIIDWLMDSNPENYSELL